MASLRREGFWAGYRESGVALPVEAVFLTRDYERSLASNKARGAKGGHEVPPFVMERYHAEAEPPTLAEGFARVRHVENEYDELSGTGGFVERRVDEP